MITLNLIPDIKNDYIKAKRSRDRIIAWSLVVGGSFAGLVVVAGIIVTVQWFIVDGTKDSIENLYGQLQDKENITTVLTTQGQLQELPYLHENKPRATRLFSYLTTLTPDNARLSSVDVDFDSNTAEIRGSTDSIRDLNILVDTFKAAQYRLGPTVDIEDEQFESLATQLDEEFEDMELSDPAPAFNRVVSSLNIQTSGEGINFTLRFAFNSDLFDARYSAVQMLVPDFVDRDPTAPGVIFDDSEEEEE